MLCCDEFSIIDGMMIFLNLFFFFFFKQKTAYEMLRSLVGSEMCIRDSSLAEETRGTSETPPPAYSGGTSRSGRGCNGFSPHMTASSVVGGRRGNRLPKKRAMAFKRSSAPATPPPVRFSALTEDHARPKGYKIPMLLARRGSKVADEQALEGPAAHQPATARLHGEVTHPRPVQLPNLPAGVRLWKMGSLSPLEIGPKHQVAREIKPVSYTHLTLPTKRIV
eukprot:TRINITY_DN62864_c0_g1_i2.p1 TRINITY_DN62864_c0_g1~~TRINITY_DN62864_c0_g1_i2.p1  ORF type:complete len:222 (+),score=42.63 TRINITY_DN62864_c0_g1_i2:45-710(+)